MDEGIPKKEEKKEVESFSVEFFEERLLSLLQSSKVNVIKNPKLKGIGKEITLSTTVTSWGGTIEIQATLENRSNVIMVKNHSIDAVWPYKGKAEKLLVPYFDEISELLKGCVEDEKNKKVEKIWIEDGQLKVIYKKEKKPEQEKIVPAVVPEIENVPEDSKKELENLADVEPIDWGKFTETEIVAPEIMGKYQSKIEPIDAEFKEISAEDLKKEIEAQMVIGEFEKKKENDLGNEPISEKTKTEIKEWLKKKLTKKTIILLLVGVVSFVAIKKIIEKSDYYKEKQQIEEKEKKEAREKYRKEVEDPYEERLRRWENLRKEKEKLEQEKNKK